MPFLVRGQQEEGIPVRDQTVLNKCASCHPVDERGNMQRISWERASPEAWEEALKRMIRTHRIVVTQAQARGMMKYLSGTHGLAPAESKPVLYDAERRIQDEAGTADKNLLDACAKCHSLARALSWRRSSQDWKEFTDAHAARYKLKLNPEAVALLAKDTPLHSPAWAEWSARAEAPDLTGHWLVTAHVPGRGRFFGDMEVTPGGNAGDLLSRVTLRSVKDGSTIVRTGHVVVYAGYEWRGRSKGTALAVASGPYDLASEAREVLWFAADGRSARGRWFWGQYQEFGFDVTLQRASGTTLLALDVTSLKSGSRGNRVRLLGEGFPDQVTTADVVAGAGVTVRRILSRTPGEIVAEMDVAADANLGKRDVAFRSSLLPQAFALYDRVDYVKVTPESSLAAFGSEKYAPGFQQFEAIGFQRGPDGRLHTADDLELGPVDATWSMEVFYEVDGSQRDLVGKVSQTGFFTPAATNSGINYDIWVIATASQDKGKDGQPLIGKGYVVVTVPTYTFEGRSYVRELDRWIEEGSGTR